MLYLGYVVGPGKCSYDSLKLSFKQCGIGTRSWKPTAAGRADWSVAGEHVGMSFWAAFEQMASLSIQVQITPVTSENQTRFFRTVKSGECYGFCDIREIASHPSFWVGKIE